MRRVKVLVLLWVGVFLFAVEGRLGLADDLKHGIPRADPAADEALKEELLKLNRAISADMQRIKLRVFLKDKEKARKGVALALQMQEEAPDKARPFNFSGAMILARAAHALKQNRPAQFFYDCCIDHATRLESGEKILRAYDGMLDLYWDTKRYDDLIEVCERFTEIKGLPDVDRAKPFVLERSAQARARQGRTDEALRIVEELVQQDQGGFYFLQLKGWVQREAGNFGESIKAYLEALDRLEETKGLNADLKERMKDRVRYTLSGVYIDNKQIDKAAEQLQTLIQKNPNNPTYKNDLGFKWANHDMNLDEAEKLIREAIELDRKQQEKARAEQLIDEVKEKASYLDSLGWVLFKQKKYKEALVYLKKASDDENEGSHLEIWDHLGEVYMALGQKNEAIDAWQKGLSMEDVSRRDGERRRKVTAKLKAAGVEPKPIPRKPSPKDMD